MAQVRIKGRDGVEQTLEVTPGGALMDVLRDAGTGVDGTCGGACSCGTCHVYVASEWVDRLGPRSEDETLMLEAIGDFVEIRPTSRLSCQIPAAEAIDGLSLEIAPPV